MFKFGALREFPPAKETFVASPKVAITNLKK